VESEGSIRGAQGILPSRLQAAVRGRPFDPDPLGRLWRLFASLRLALVLILLITGAVLAGTVIAQAPPSVLASPALYDQWLESMRGKYGSGVAGGFDFLGLFYVFQTWWFRLLLALLTVNIIVCSINRWKGIWITSFRARVRMGEAFFKHARFNARMGATVPVSAAAAQVRDTLSRSRYRVREEADESTVAMYADRNRFSRFGTFFTHISIVLLLVGAIVGGLWGFRDDEFIVAEGATREVGFGTGLAVMLEHFADEYYLEGPPKDYRSDVVLYERGVEVKRGTIRVNEPMKHNGVRFFQSFYGQTAVMEVKDDAGTLLYNGGVPLAWRTRDGDRPVGSFNLPAHGLSVYVIGPPSGENDPLIPAGEMRVEIYRQSGGRLLAAENVVQGAPAEIGGLEFNFQRESRFTGLSVAKDPGLNIIWVACGLMVLGLFMLFYFPHRRLWVLCRPRPDGGSEVLMGTTAERDLSLTNEFARVAGRMRLILSGRSAPQNAQGGGHV
jgi:cytochrome c biogenesis protein